MQSLKTGILLVNLGTPDSPSTADVRKYLREFLSDPRVIDISPLGRFALVNFIIAPFRAPKSAKLYKEIWNQNGSPLLYYTQKQKNGQTEQRTIYHYIYTYAEMDFMLAQSGFKLLRAYAQPDGEPYEFGDEQAYLVAQKI